MRLGRSQILRAVAPVGACALAMLVAGCGSSTNTNSASYGTAPVKAPPQTPAGTRPAVVVRMQGLRFSPASVHVAAGQTIEWVNRDSVVHNVTSSDGTAIMSGNFGPGKKFEFTAKLAGTFTYYCTIHSTTMKGRIVVGGR